jgi:hypothetical protein
VASSKRPQTFVTTGRFGSMGSVLSCVTRCVSRPAHWIDKRRSEVADS